MEKEQGQGVIKKIPTFDTVLAATEPLRKRKRGFVDWARQAATLEILLQVQDILREYEAYLPLTIRQIFYRLVGKYEYAKTNNAYQNLSNYLNDARRARMIDMDNIRDDTSVIERPRGWESGTAFLQAVRGNAAQLKLDRSAEQPCKLILYCEAGGMVPQLTRIAHPFGIAVHASGGCDSLTDKYALAKHIAALEQPVEILHIGDMDIEGVDLYRALMEDVEAFAWQDFDFDDVTFTRLAVTPQQIHDYQLPPATAIPKVYKEAAKQQRAELLGPTYQAEAIAPDDLANIVQSAIEERYDIDAYEDVLKREQREQKRLVRLLKSITK